MTRDTSEPHGPGLGDRLAEPSCHHLSVQLSTVGLEPTIETALAAIGELQDMVRRERGERDLLLLQIHDLERRGESGAHPHAVQEAQRALLSVTRGECMTTSRSSWSDTYATHDEELTGYNCQTLVRATPTLDLALHAVTELCWAFHDVIHRLEATEEERSSAASELKDLLVDYDETVDERDDLRSALLGVLEHVAPAEQAALEAMDDDELVTESQHLVRRLGEDSAKPTEAPPYRGPRLSCYEVIRALRDGREPVPEWVEDVDSERDVGVGIDPALAPFGARPSRCVSEL